jgi:hypothetical protein
MMRMYRRRFLQTSAEVANTLPADLPLPRAVRGAVYWLVVQERSTTVRTMSYCGLRTTRPRGAAHRSMRRRLGVCSRRLCGNGLFEPVRQSREPIGEDARQGFTTRRGTDVFDLRRRAKPSRATRVSSAGKIDAQLAIYSG